MAIVVSTGVSGLAQKKDVTFNSADGASLKAALYAKGSVGPGILLLRDCREDLQPYDEAATMLSTAGYVVLVPDVRQGSDKIAGDIDSALKLLTSQDIVNRTTLGVIAAGCSISDAFSVVRRNSGFKAAVVISGGGNAETEAYIKSSNLPVLGIASEDDVQVTAAVRKLVEASPNKESQLDTFKNVGHAGAIFTREPSVSADIVIFFRSNLPIGGYGSKPAK
jgi:dienelactone hydrolase